MAIYKRGKFYSYEFVCKGERVRESTRQGDRETAKALEAVHRARLAREEVGIFERKAAPALRDFEQKFIDHIRAHSAAKPLTVKFYVEKLKRLLKFPTIADSRLDRIDEELIGSYVQFRRRQVAPAAVNRELATLRRLLRLAQEWRVIDRVPRIRLLPGERERDFVLNPKQEQLYLEFAADPLHDVALLLVDTGLRPGEALALEWADVHLIPAAGARAGYLHIRQGKSPKAKRNLMLSERVSSMLRRRERRKACALVFTAPDGQGPLSYDTLKDQHDRARRLLKLPGEFVIYSLRHTFGTRLGESGADAFTIMRIMGHSTITISQRYVHPTPELLERTFERLQVFNLESRRGLPGQDQAQGVPTKVPTVENDAVELKEKVI